MCLFFYGKWSLCYISIILDFYAMWFALSVHLSRLFAKAPIGEVSVLLTLFPLIDVSSASSKTMIYTSTFCRDSSPRHVFRFLTKPAIYELAISWGDFFFSSSDLAFKLPTLWDTVKHCFHSCNKRIHRLRLTGIDTVLQTHGEILEVNE